MISRLEKTDHELAAAVQQALFPEHDQELYAVYLFGSGAEGRLRTDSDLDIAFLGPRCKNPTQVFDAAQRLATSLKRDVDLVDLATASTVMRTRIIGEGKRIHVGDRYRTDLFEMHALSDYARLQEERAQAIRAFTAAYAD